MSTFFEEQTAQDLIIARNIANGYFGNYGIQDECRRWSVCDRCEIESPEMRRLWEQIAWEDDHYCFACAPTVAEWNAEPLEAEDPIFPYPAPYTFARRLEELPETVHVTRKVDHSFTSGRTPQASRRAA